MACMGFVKMVVWASLRMAKQDLVRLQQSRANGAKALPRRGR